MTFGKFYRRSSRQLVQLYNCVSSVVFVSYYTKTVYYPPSSPCYPHQVPEQDWIGDYKSQISSPQSCINEWEALPDLLSRRPLSPDHFSQISPDAQDAETKKTVIKAKLRSVPVSPDQ